MHLVHFFLLFLLFLLRLHFLHGGLGLSLFLKMTRPGFGFDEPLLFPNIASALGIALASANASGRAIAAAIGIGHGPASGFA